MPYLSPKTPDDRAGIDHPTRILVVSTHPIQYAAPIFRLLAANPKVELLVAYCSMEGAERYIDRDFGTEVKWDVPLLDGYSWIALKNRSPFRGHAWFFRFVNPQVWRLIRSGKFDAVVLYTGYLCATFWIAILAAKRSHAAVLFGTDAHDLSPRDGMKWKIWAKKMFWPRLFRCADMVIVPSSGGVALMTSLGISATRIALTPYAVNNDWWTEQSRKVDRAKVRRRWGIPEDSVTVLFSAKLQPWKRPLDVLRAFARLSISNMHLVFAGDGSLRPILESETERLGVTSRVRFLGFVNQSGLPETYTACDVLVLPSEYEPFGVVVNEAMLCGCCAVVSDRVGARFDLVREGETGFVFRARDVNDLARVLGEVSADPENLKRLKRAARDRVRDWSPSANVKGLLEAVRRVTPRPGIRETNQKAEQ
ncbi:MAG: glycosyltransferase family 4 protein [Candidatus Acidiferrales bacterium]